MTILNQRIILKDDIEFVTEFPCILGHPVYIFRYNGTGRNKLTDRTVRKDYILNMYRVQRYIKIMLYLLQS